MDSQPAEIDLMAGGSVKFTEDNDDNSSVTASKNEIGHSQRHIQLASLEESAIRSQADQTQNIS